MRLFTEAHAANRKAKPGSHRHSGVTMICFRDDGEDYGFQYLGQFESPRMATYDLSREFNPRFEAWFLERLKAYAVLYMVDPSDLCYLRGPHHFGRLLEEQDMVYPFRN